VVLLATFLLTIFVDLITGIGVGVVFGALLFLHRMAEAVEVRGGPHGEPQLVPEDAADTSSGGKPFDAAQATNHDIMVYRISGAFFFGATARVSLMLERLAAHPRIFILDFSDVPLIDSTAAHSLASFTRRLRKSGTAVYFAATRPSVRKELVFSGLDAPDVRYVATVADAKQPV
jgi:SulP family sulfate permease